MLGAMKEAIPDLGAPESDRHAPFIAPGLVRELANEKRAVRTSQRGRSSSSAGSWSGPVIVRRIGARKSQGTKVLIPVDGACGSPRTSFRNEAFEIVGRQRRRLRATPSTGRAVCRLNQVCCRALRQSGDSSHRGRPTRFGSVHRLADCSTARRCRSRRTGQMRACPNPGVARIHVPSSRLRNAMRARSSPFQETMGFVTDGNRPPGNERFLVI